MGSPADDTCGDAPAPVPASAALPWAAATTVAAPAPHAPMACADAGANADADADADADAGAGANADADDPQQQQQQPLLLSEVGLAPGDRIQVKWRVHPDEGPSYSRWWGARVVGPAAATKAAAPAAAGDADADDAAPAPAPAPAPVPQQPQQQPQYELVYDAHDGFDEERSVVRFLGPHRVAEVPAAAAAAAKKEEEEGEGEEGGKGGDCKEAEEGGEVEGGGEQAAPQVLPWRREGDDAYDESSEEEDEGEGVVSVREMQQSGALLGEREALDAEAAALSGLPAEQQRAVASGFRDYIDTFKAFVRAKMQEAGHQAGAGGGAADGAGGGADGQGGGDASAQGEPLTITEAMVAEFSAVVRNAKRARTGGGDAGAAPKSN